MKVRRNQLPKVAAAAAIALLAGLVSVPATAAPPAAAAAPPAPRPAALAAPAAPQLSAAVAALPWMNTALSPQQRSDLLLAAMTLDQKIEQMQNNPAPEQISGTYLAEGNKQATCGFTALARHVEGIPALGIPTLREVNAGNGIRGGNCTPEPIKTAGPSATVSAASFDPQAVRGWGEVVGSEAKTFAHQILLGPAANLVRNPFEGRAQEYPGEDPYLAGVVTTAQIQGIQSQGTQTMIKHYMGNENEFSQERWTGSVRIPSQAMHELYLLPFEMAIRDAKPAGLMCAYPMVNYQWNCDSQDSLTKTLTSWGYDGWIESDRVAMHSTARAIKAGVGFELDWFPVFFKANLIKDAIKYGELTESDLDKVLKPRYVQMFKFGNFDHPEEWNSFGVDNLTANAAKARTLAEQGITLLKNDKNILPLGKNVTSIALIGPKWFAGQAVMPPRSIHPDDNVSVVPPYTVTPLQGIKNELARIGSNATVTYNNASNMDSAVALAKKSDMVIMMLGTNPRETEDLKKLNLPVINGVDQHTLAWKVTQANPNNVVVLKTAAGVTMNWASHARAIVAAWFPGQDDGDVVAGVLFGRINPSGKTPVTWPSAAKQAAWENNWQYPGVHENTGFEGGKSRNPKPGQKQLVAYYSEGMSMGYRWYQQNDVAPAFAFGHGLSYTAFAYSDLKLKKSTAKGKPVVTAQFRVTNTGKVEGQEVPQVYLTLPAESQEPSMRLVGFDKIDLQPNKSKVVRITIDSAASNHPFGYFKPASDDLRDWLDGSWVQANGSYTVHVGGASDSTPLTKAVNLKFPKN
ncbi:beta-glucosidase family protein [Nakamurella lactea]|uniref:beta-glucosidase family protein n=1 Tax=Nakamurella lactea TaxID=459515 RepID=UPI000406B77E|nr:glycoside hydrolase family 3 protein [Nakamurella lactea]